LLANLKVLIEVDTVNRLDGIGQNTGSLRNGIEGVVDSDDNVKVRPRVEDGKLVPDIEVVELVSRTGL
jgi:hypothetical protein